MATRAEVYEALDGERAFQVKKWGADREGVGAFLVYMEEYLAKARRALTENEGTKLALHELRKVTALGVACLEQHGAPPRMGQAPPVNELLHGKVYGHDRTLHRSTWLDVEVGPDGKVCAVWFRCAALPFREHRVSDARGAEMKRGSSEHWPALLAVELADR